MKMSRRSGRSLPMRMAHTLRANIRRLKVSSGDRFLADVGCLKDQKKCDVIFRLRYQIGDDDPVDLGHWDETYDGDITRIDVDLSALDGEISEIYPYG